MHRLVFTIGLIAVLAGTGFAQTTRTNIRVYDLGSPETTTSFTIPRNTVAYTSVFPLNGAEYYGLSYKLTSAETSPNIRLQLEQSYRMPGIDNDADSYWVVPDNMADIATGITSETQHHIALSPAPFAYGRIKVTEAGVANDTVVTLKVTAIGESVNKN